MLNPAKRVRRNPENSCNFNVRISAKTDPLLHSPQYIPRRCCATSDQGYSSLQRATSYPTANTKCRKSSSDCGCSPLALPKKNVILSCGCKDVCGCSNNKSLNSSCWCGDKDRYKLRSTEKAREKWLNALSQGSSDSAADDYFSKTQTEDTKKNQKVLFDEKKYTSSNSSRPNGLGSLKSLKQSASNPCNSCSNGALGQAVAMSGMMNTGTLCACTEAPGGESCSCSMTNRANAPSTPLRGCCSCPKCFQPPALRACTCPRPPQQDGSVVICAPMGGYPIPLRMGFSTGAVPSPMSLGSGQQIGPPQPTTLWTGSTDSQLAASGSFESSNHGKQKSILPASLQTWGCSPGKQGPTNARGSDREKCGCNAPCPCLGKVNLARMPGQHTAGCGCPNLDGLKPRAHDWRQYHQEMEERGLSDKDLEPISSKSCQTYSSQGNDISVQCCMQDKGLPSAKSRRVSGTNTYDTSVNDSQSRETARKTEPTPVSQRKPEPKQLVQADLHEDSSRRNRDADSEVDEDRGRANRRDMNGKSKKGREHSRSSSKTRNRRDQSGSSGTSKHQSIDNSRESHHSGSDQRQVQVPVGVMVWADGPPQYIVVQRQLVWNVPPAVVHETRSTSVKPSPKPSPKQSPEPSPKPSPKPSRQVSSNKLSKEVGPEPPPREYKKCYKSCMDKLESKNGLERNNGLDRESGGRRKGSCRFCNRPAPAKLPMEQSTSEKRSSDVRSFDIQSSDIRSSDVRSADVRSSDRRASTTMRSSDDIRNKIGCEKVHSCSKSGQCKNKHGPHPYEKAKYYQ